MFNADNEFEKLNLQVHLDEEKYLNAEVTIENYNFPHIYLTDEEIEQFNKDCEQYGYDIKAVPLITYMNLNSPDKSFKLDDSEEDDMENKEKNVDKFMNHLGKNYHAKEEKKEKKENNKFVGKKRNKVLEDSFEEEKSVKSSFKSKSILSNRSKKSDSSDKSNLTEDNKDNESKMNLDEEDKNDNKSNRSVIKDKKKKLIKKKKHPKKTDEIAENFNNYFRKIRETRQKQTEDEKRKGPLIDQILEGSQLLTPDSLRELARVNHIGLIDNTTLRRYDLEKKDVNQLDRIMVDINFNSNVLKLNTDGKENIKKMKNRLEKEKKANEEHLENKKLKEEERKKYLNELKNKNKDNESKKEDKKESDISDDSDDDLI